MRKTKVILFSLTALLLFISLIQKQFHVIHFKHLEGVVYEVGMPKLTFASFCDGSFQSQTERHLKQQFGFREPLIRFYNQYLWDFYGKTHAIPYQFVEGKDGWLYEPWFVEEYYQGRSYRVNVDSAEVLKRFEKEALRVYQLQHILDSYGVKMFVCLLPGKDMIYPEYLPENTKYFKKNQVKAYDFYSRKFKEMGINCIDVADWFLQMKDTADFLLFPQKGTHWSNMAAVYAADSIFRYMEHLGGIEMNDLDISEPYVGKVKKPDDDLESLMNLSRPLKKIPHKYVDVKVVENKDAVKPRMITIGDSYYWNILNQLETKKLFSKNPYWYYNSTIYFDKPKTSVKDVDVVKELLSCDFVMLSYCTVQAYEFGNGFADDAVFSFCYDENEMEEVRQKIAGQIMNNGKWKEGVERLAVERNSTFEKELDNNVTWFIQNRFESSFPALADSIPSKRSNELMRRQNRIMFYRHVFYPELL